MALLPQFRTNKASTSNFNYSHRLRTTMPAGVKIPVLTAYGVPGQRFELDLTASIKTLQTLAPVMGSFAVQFDIVWSNLSNYMPSMRNNEINGGWVSNDLELPCLNLAAKYSSQAQRLNSLNPLTGNPIWLREYHQTSEGVMNVTYIPIGEQDAIATPQYPVENGESYVYELATVSPSSLWAYLDYGSGMFYCGTEEGADSDPDKLLGLGFLTYWDYIRNYVANPQEDAIPCYGIGSDLVNSYSDNRRMQTARPNSKVTLTALDSFFRAFSARDDRSNNDNDVLWYWRKYVAGSGSNTDEQTFSADELYDHFSGLAVGTYFPDYFTGRLNSTRVDDYVSTARVQVTNGSFTIDSLRFGNKLSKLLNLSLFSGGRFDDWQRAQWSVKPRHDITIPEIIGSFTMDISFDEIVSLSGAETGDNPTGTGLGAVAGRVDDGNSSKKHYFETDTYGCFMVVANIIPRIGYSNNRSRFAVKTNLDDWYIPAFDRLGFQDLFQYELSALPQFDVKFQQSNGTGNFTGAVDNEDWKDTIGKSPAWLEYMTRTDRIRGNFSDEVGNSPYWTLQPTAMDYYIYAGNGNYGKSIPVTLSSLAQTMIDLTASGDDFEELPIHTANEWNWSSYIDPHAVNAIFPDQSKTAENFYLQVYFGFKTNLEKSKELLPTY